MKLPLNTDEYDVQLNLDYFKMFYDLLYILYWVMNIFIQIHQVPLVPFVSRFPSANVRTWY